MPPPITAKEAVPISPPSDDISMELEGLLARTLPSDIRVVAHTQLDEAEIQKQEEDFHKRTQYADSLYAHLGRVARLALPETAVTGILDNFPEWDYLTTRVRHQKVHFFRRQILDSSLVLLEPNIQEERRRVWRNERAVTIMVNEVTGADIRYLIDIDRQIPTGSEGLNQLGLPLTENERSDLVGNFRIAQIKDKRNKVPTPISESQKIVMSLLTRVESNEDIAQALNISGSTVSRLLKPLSDKLGVKSKIDLALVAIAMEWANLDHIPDKDIDFLDDKEKHLLAAYYSPDESERATVRGSNYTTSWRLWKAIIEKLGVNSKSEAIFIAVKAGKLRLPEKADIAARLGMNTDSA